MPIRRLPPLLVNQIAAGEVVERPASVVKELVENAIDAGATRIEIEIEGGGRDLIRIVDDGHGIAPDELELAVASHATSKITEPSDLESIATLGFRGEALASIASVSQFELVSRTHERDEGARIEVDGDRVRPVEPAGAAPGTSITVRNLFFNTPARRKFLRTDQTELGRITTAVQNLALPHPAIGFTLVSGGRRTIDLPAGQSPRARVEAIFGNELSSELLEVDRRESSFGVWGLIGQPDLARGTSKHLRVFINGRSISDRAITHAVREAYRGLIEPARYPTVALFLDIDPTAVDVNVHPAKAEVRFRQPSHVHQRLVAAVRETLAEANIVPVLDLSRREPAPEFGRGAVGEHGRAPAAATSGSPPPPPPRAGDARFVMEEMREALERRAYAEREREAPVIETKLPEVRAADEVLQIHSSYLVTQDEDGLVIIDQHALHERIMFEELKARIADNTLESQRMLMPAIVETDDAGMERLEAIAPLLERLGIAAEPMGPRTIAIHGFTSLLFDRNVDPIDFLRELLEHVSTDGGTNDAEALLHEVLDMMACKAAIKAGDRLTPAEMKKLLERRDIVDRSTRCPHGRPTTLRLSIEELERQFGRR